MDPVATAPGTDSMHDDLQQPKLEP